MYATVKLLNGFPEPLTYELPAQLAHCTVGTIVRVPLRNNLVSGVIVHLHEERTSFGYTIKPIAHAELFPEDTSHFPFIQQLASYYQIPTSSLLKRLKQCITQEQDTSLVDPFTQTNEDHQLHMLTNEQQKIVDWIHARMNKNIYTPTVIHGVTGSGKTEIYKHLIMHAYNSGTSSLLMLPEVTLALRFTHLMRACLPPEISLFGFHSASPAKEKKQLWQTLLAKKPCLIIGVHLPILLPLPNLGVIMVDEEHENGYQEKKHPKINSKEAALLRAYHAKIPIILGSATPSLSTLYNVSHKGWHFFELKERFAGAFPKVRCIPLAKNKERKSFWITRELERAIADRLKKGEQTIIFLNRRGYSFFVQCKECSYIFSCEQCSVSLTLHEGKRLSCHYCGHEQILTTSCPGCKAGQDSLLKKGVGTQQVVTILQQLFPQARIARADLDSTTKKKAWEQTVHAIEQGKLDIIVGTQTITKGYHFPKVTLVGILWADLNLHFPIYHATETTLQQLIQVAGRAGRASQESEVIIQAMIDHPVFAFVNERDYRLFYEEEIKKREMVGYPPALCLSEIELKSADEERLDQESVALARMLQEHTKQYKDIVILGPAKPPIHKIKNMYTRKIYLKGPSVRDLTNLFRLISKKHFKSTIFYTPNPLG